MGRVSHPPARVAPRRRGGVLWRRASRRYTLPLAARRLRGAACSRPGHRGGRSGSICCRPPGSREPRRWRAAAGQAAHACAGAGRGGEATTGRVRVSGLREAGRREAAVVEVLDRWREVRAWWDEAGRRTGGLQGAPLRRRRGRPARGRAAGRGSWSGWRIERGPPSYTCTSGAGSLSGSGWRRRRSWSRPRRGWVCRPWRLRTGTGSTAFPVSSRPRIGPASFRSSGPRSRRRGGHVVVLAESWKGTVPCAGSSRSTGALPRTGAVPCARYLRWSSTRKA